MTGPSTRVPSPGGMRLAIAGESHAGLQRDENEDAFLTDEAAGLVVVADGMGGHGHGDVAARLVVDSFRATPPAHEGDVAAALMRANASVRGWAKAHSAGRMGATAVALVLKPGRGLVGWAGDARAYRFAHGRLQLLTRDHSLVQDLVDQGRITAAEADTHPHANVVTRAVGALDDLVPDIAEVALARGDRFLVCSDGLTRCVAERTIAGILAGSETPAAAVARLIAAALDAGAPDNVTVVVVQLDGAAAP